MFGYCLLQTIRFSYKTITQQYELKLKNDINTVVSEGLQFDESYKILIEKKKELRKIGDFESHTFSIFETGWLHRSRKTIERQMISDVLYSEATEWSNTMVELAALVTFLIVQINEKFYSGSFKIGGEDIMLADNIEMEGIIIP